MPSEIVLQQCCYPVLLSALLHDHQQVLYIRHSQS